MIIPLKYNVRSLFQRKSRSVLTILGIAAVISTFVAMFAFGKGMEKSFAAAGSEDNIVVLQKGAFSETLSSIPRSSRDVVQYFPNIKKKDGQVLVAPELVVEPWVTVPGKKEDVFMMARGVEPVFFDVEDTIRILQGSPELRGNRVLLGRSAQHKLGGIQNGASILMHGEQWTVAGLFEAGGTNLESAILADLSDLMRATSREDYSSYALKLDSPTRAPRVVSLLENDQRVSVSAMREPEYFSAAGTTFTFVARLALLISLVVTLGAIFGGMNTMYTAVSGRMREIGTLRALGFGKNSILVSFLSESLLLSVSGGIIGVALGCLVNGFQIGVMHSSIRFNVTGGVILYGLLLSLFVGIVGGLLPAYGAARLRIVDTIRHL